MKQLFIGLLAATTLSAYANCNIKSVNSLIEMTHITYNQERDETKASYSYKMKSIATNNYSNNWNVKYLGVSIKEMRQLKRETAKLELESSLHQLYQLADQRVHQTTDLLIFKWEVQQNELRKPRVQTNEMIDSCRSLRDKYINELQRIWSENL